MVIPPRFLSCDWGTSRLRLRWVETSTARVVAERTNEMGVKRTHAEWQSARGERMAFYADLLAGLVSELEVQSGSEIRDTWLLISGMASSSVGMLELPYAELPFPLNGKRVVCRTLDRPLRGGIRPVLVSGIRGEADVIRGEETQMIGLHSSVPALPPEGVFVLPGTHSKHLHVRSGEIVGFRTFMTGEIFDTVVHHTILRASTERGDLDEKGRSAFEEGVEASRREPLLHALFQVRGASLLAGRGARESFWFVSGLLIGAELCSLSRSPAIPIVLCADAALAELYASALRMLGWSAGLTRVPADLVERSVAEGHRVLLAGLVDGEIAGAEWAVREVRAHSEGAPVDPNEKELR